MTERVKSVYIETYGCQMNVSDTERASTRLREAGYEITDSAKSADVVLLNTCSVREKAEKKAIRRVREIERQRDSDAPLIGLMGCVAQLQGESLFEVAPSLKLVVGTRATDRVVDLIERVEGGNDRVIDLGERQDGEEWNISPQERHSEKVAFVPIIEGCNKFCTYCIVPYSRGRERSRTAYEIIEEVSRLSKLGYRELHLIGQNVNSYRPKTDRGLEPFVGATPFSRLLRAVAATGFERIKFTTSFPRDFHTDIVKAIEENENLCNWVHLPVQSGSDNILRKMRRGHKIADYLERVEAIKDSHRRIALTSDIIIGFPGETYDEFRETVSLVERCRFDGLYIFKYSERKGTPAANLPDDVSPEEKTIRFLELEEVQMRNQRAIYDSYVGEDVAVLVENLSARSSEDLTGHTTCHKVVNFRGDQSLIGEIVQVRVVEARAHSLYGELLG